MFSGAFAIAPDGVGDGAGVAAGIASTPEEYLVAVPYHRVVVARGRRAGGRQHRPGVRHWIVAAAVVETDAAIPSAKGDHLAARPRRCVPVSSENQERVPARAGTRLGFFHSFTTHHSLFLISWTGTVQTTVDGETRFRDGIVVY